MITYAQNLEDVLLARVFRDQPQGFYVDVGANHPIKLSITKHFYDLGWQGINVEPGKIYEQLAAARPRDTNLNVAVSNVAGERTFYEFPVGHALSSFNPDLPPVEEHWLAGRIERTVTTVTLREMFEQHQPPTIDFMNVDVEGHQKEVLEGNDWSRWRPRVVLTEATDPSQTQVFTQENWESILLEAHYRPVFFDGLNRYYLRDEDRHLAERFAAPANVLDNFVPAQVVELRHSLGEKTSQLREKSAKARQQENRLERIVKDYRAIKTQSQELKEAVLKNAEELQEAVQTQADMRTGAQKKYDEYQEQINQLEQKLEERLQRLRAIRRRLHAREAELGQMMHCVGPQSLKFGLRIARLIHKISELPAKVFGRKAA